MIALFTCPVCGALSHNPKDKQHGYCARCHEFTGENVVDLITDEHGVLMLKQADAKVRYPTDAEIKTMIASLQTAERMARVDASIARQLSTALAEIARLKASK